jgi:hypothetical protein
LKNIRNDKHGADDTVSDVNYNFETHPHKKKIKKKKSLSAYPAVAQGQRANVARVDGDKQRRERVHQVRKAVERRRERVVFAADDRGGAVAPVVAADDPGDLALPPQARADGGRQIDPDTGRLVRVKRPAGKKVILTIQKSEIKALHGILMDTCCCSSR